MAKEHLYQVGLQHKKSKETFNLQVWAKNTDEATHKLTGTLIGYDSQYSWRGTNVLYENNKPITRSIAESK